MLVLERHKEEAILIGKNIRIQILGITNKRVCLGIEAPKDILIVREELIDEEQSPIN